MSALEQFLLLDSRVGLCHSSSVLPPSLIYTLIEKLSRNGSPSSVIKWGVDLQAVRVCGERWNRDANLTCAKVWVGCWIPKVTVTVWSQCIGAQLHKSQLARLYRLWVKGYQDHEYISQDPRFLEMDNTAADGSSPVLKVNNYLKLCELSGSGTFAGIAALLFKI